MLFLIGLIKKVIIADLILAPRVDVLFAASSEWSTATSWLLGLLFGFQIYFDFSGYVDMALGLGRLVGLELKPNFSTPYVARTPSEFWSRWNITLSRWFGDYVYIPLGGSRKGLTRTSANLFITMLASGLWHGAGFNYVLWGAIHGSWLCAYHATKQVIPSLAAAITKPRWGIAAVSGWAMTFVVTVVAWVYFRATSVAEANMVLASMFGFGTGIRSLPLVKPLLLAAMLLALHFAEAEFLKRHDVCLDLISKFWRRVPGPMQALLVFPILLFALGITKEVQGAFIYFQF
jgi:alginate O-acetyltransferase complex protein AlgI